MNATDRLIFSDKRNNHFHRHASNVKILIQGGTLGIIFQRKVLDGNLLVGVTGLEPAASTSQMLRATNCATPRGFILPQVE